MKSVNSILVLVLSICLLGCAFEGNQEVKKNLRESVNNFHILFNQEKFDQIYSNADEELKNKFTQQQFVSYLEFVKKNDVGELKEVPQVWIENESSDGIAGILFRKKIFSSIVTIYTERNIYIEYFEWKLKNGEAKLVSYEIRESSNARREVIID